MCLYLLSPNTEVVILACTERERGYVILWVGWLLSKWDIGTCPPLLPLLQNQAVIYEINPPFLHAGARSLDIYLCFTCQQVK